jgi:hypothetical protein
MFRPAPSPVEEGARQSLNGDPFERLPVVGEGADHGTRGGCVPHFQLNSYGLDALLRVPARFAGTNHGKSWRWNLV